MERGKKLNRLNPVYLERENLRTTEGRTADEKDDDDVVLKKWSKKSPGKNRVAVR